jgi:hypothetical protein
MYLVKYLLVNLVDVLGIGAHLFSERVDSSLQLGLVRWPFLHEAAIEGLRHAQHIQRALVLQGLQVGRQLILHNSGGHDEWLKDPGTLIVVIDVPLCLFQQG